MLYHEFRLIIAPVFSTTQINTSYYYWLTARSKGKIIGLSCNLRNMIRNCDIITYISYSKLIFSLRQITYIPIVLICPIIIGKGIRQAKGSTAYGTCGMNHIGCICIFYNFYLFDSHSILSFNTYRSIRCSYISSSFTAGYHLYIYSNCCGRYSYGNWIQIRITGWVTLIIHQTEVESISIAQIVWNNYCLKIPRAKKNFLGILTS